MRQFRFGSLPVTAVLATTAVAATVAVMGAPTAHGAAAPKPPSPTVSVPPPAVLAQVHTVGRIRPAGSAIQFTWPGTHVEGRFRGTGVGLLLDDSANDYVVQIDGTTVANLVTPGRTTYWVRNLADTVHTVRLVKRTESPYSAGQFGGLLAVEGGAILAKPAPRTRQVEFIGDSWTAGYGNTSGTRDCSSIGGFTRNSNADAAFSALTARRLNADYQLNAWSGMGLVRNYNGQNSGVDFRTYYPTDLQAQAGSATWQAPRSWKPQVVVIGLGINDFSTALNPGEKWSTTDQLAADYRSAYLSLIQDLRIRYGTSAQIVLTYPDLSYATTALADSVRQVAQLRRDQGDSRVTALYYDDNALGLDKLGCDWHPSERDHRLLADALTAHLSTLALTW